MLHARLCGSTGNKNIYQFFYSLSKNGRLVYLFRMFKKLMNLFKAEKMSKAKKRQPRTIVLRTQGTHYDLKEIYDRVNDHYFEGKLPLHITWFSPKKGKYQRRIVLGSFHRDKNLIRINRVLDEADIPAYYISFIVYHEILHHVAPPIIQRFRKRQIHHSEFKRLEKQFEQYEQVKEFRKRSKTRWFVD
jgi:hypothetical protein